MLRSLEKLESRHRDVGIETILARLDEAPAQGWSLLVEKYSRFVYSVALQLCRGVADPEEMASEIYRRVFVRLEARDRALVRNFRGKCDFRTYLYRIVRTERFRLFRRRGVERDAQEVLAREARPGGPAGPEGGWTRGLGTQVARDALRALGEEDRRILVLRFAAGLKLRELADVLPARDVNDAAYRVRRALSKCRAVAEARRSAAWDEHAFQAALEEFRRSLFPEEVVQKAEAEVSDGGDPEEEGPP
jgi:RNA polymerase sigma-70 factor (ECF subfamily)